MAAERDHADRLWLIASLGGLAGGGHLCLDVLNPDLVVPATTADSWPSEVRKGILIRDGGGAELHPINGGGLQISRTLLWSLLDPLRVSSLVRLDVTDAVAAERSLRAEARHLWERLGWWSLLPEGLRRDCRRLLVAHAGGAGRWFDLLADLAARSRSDPFQGWSAAEQTPTCVETSDRSEDQTGNGDADPEAARPVPAEPADLAAWMLDPGGLGFIYGAHYQPREEQAAMAAEIARALSEPRALLVEAGTGVGKTLAYLTPLLRNIKSHGQRAVVSTFTRTLQIQILAQDLPLLAPLFPGLKTRLLMGRNNYLCRRRRLEYLDQTPASFTDACELVALRLWLAATEDGLREELASHPLLQKHLSKLFDTAEPCSAAICYEGEDCFVQRARRLARNADLLVVNHSLLMHDLASEHSLIGPYSQLVVDEAHRLPLVALDTHSIQCDASRVDVIEEMVGTVSRPGVLPTLLRLLAQQLVPLGAPGIALQASLDELAAAFSNCFRTYRRWWSGVNKLGQTDLDVEFRARNRVRVHDKIQTFAPLRAVTQQLLTAVGQANADYARVSERVERLPELPEGMEESLATLAQAGSLLVVLEQDVRFLTSDEDEAWVTWLQPGAQNVVNRLGATMLESGNLLRDYWQGSGLKPIVTSATLAVGDDFGHMLAELGLTRWQPPTRSCSVLSPFDYDRQVLLLMPAEFPAPDQAGFGEELAELLRTLQHRVMRKTMVLFTSYRLLEAVAGRLCDDETDIGPPQPDRAEAEERAVAASGQDDLLFPSVATAPENKQNIRPAEPDETGMETSGGEPGADGSFEIFWQTRGGGSRDLQQRFRLARRAMLLGTSTFWEGIDLPGTDLEILVVTKLPFQVPNDPWVEARCGRIQAAGEDPFTTFMVTDAVLRLRQGCGRLIRRSSDRGIVLLLDTRLHTKPYGTTFLSALPAAPQISRIATISLHGCKHSLPPAKAENSTQVTRSISSRLRTERGLGIMSEPYHASVPVQLDESWLAKNEPVDLLVTGIGQLCTLSDPDIVENGPRRGAEMSALGIHSQAALAVAGGKVVAVGHEVKVRSAVVRHSSTQEIDVQGCAVIPGFVDPHTHAVFGRTRQDEYERRIRGETYLQIAAAGGGIHASVRDLRERSEAELIQLTLPRLAEMLAHGTTTVEIKSGYGLSLRDEMKMLRAGCHAAATVGLSAIMTCLAAHEIPAEYRERRADYVALVTEDVLPRVFAEGLATRCDVFCEPSVFDLAETELILSRALDLGFDVTVHADELEPFGGAALAARLGARSADHLIMIDEAGRSALAASDTVAVLLPGTVFTLGLQHYAPARELIAAGVAVALASDFNPGSSPILSQPLIQAIACTQMRLTPAEALVATTLNAAWALGMQEEVGSLAPGKQADFLVLDGSDFRLIPYQAGHNPIARVFQNGLQAVPCALDR